MDKVSVIFAQELNFHNLIQIFKHNRSYSFSRSLRWTRYTHSERMKCEGLKHTDNIIPSLVKGSEGGKHIYQGEKV